MTSIDFIGKAISAAVFFVITGAAVAAEHSPAGVTVEAFNEVSRLVNLLGARVDELEKKNHALESALDEVRQKNRDLERNGAELQQRVKDQQNTIDALESREEALMVAATGLQAQIDDIAMPDMTPFEAALGSLQSGVSVNRRQIEHHVAMISELTEKDTALMVAATGLQAQIDDLNVPDANAIKAEVSALNSTVERLAAAGETMRGQIDNLIGLDVPRLSVDLDELKGRLAGVTRTGDTIRFDGMNVQVTNGTGATDGEVNGLGNLIIGYDETISPFIDGQSPASDKSGSHNLVVGKGHNYSSFGSVVAGLDNVAAGNFSLAAGTRNQALGDFATVTGGQLNTSSGWYSSVTGGFSNLASENSASVGGGYANSATGTASSVSGGFQVRAPGNSNWAAGRLFQQQ